MAAPPSGYKDREFLAVIGDEVRDIPFDPQSSPQSIADPLQDTVTGMLLAGIGASTPISAHVAEYSC